MAEVDLKTVLDDTRARHQALTNLILYTDRQATLLFRTFITVTLATSAAAASVLLSPAWEYLGAWRWGLVGLAASFGIGCVACLRAMAPAGIGLTGHGADFWLWATKDGKLNDRTLSEYLTRTKDAQEQDLATNEKAGKALNWAKRLALGSPLIAGAAVLVAYAIDHFFRVG